MFDRAANRIPGVLSREVGQRAALGGGEVTERKLHDGRVVAFLRLRLDVVLSPGAEPSRSVAGNRAWVAHGLLVGGVKVVEERRPALVRTKALALFGHELFELVDADFLNEELDAGASAALLFAKAGKDAGDRLGKGKKLFFGAELGEHLGLHRHGAEPSTDDDAEAALAITDMGDRTEIVKGDEPTGIVFTARERDLELASEVLNVGVPQEELRDRIGIRCDVERLRLADTGVLTGRHVAHAVAAGLTGGDPDAGEPSHHVGRLFDVNEVKLDVLPRRDVQDRIGVLLGELAQHLELLRGELPERDLDPHHARRVPNRVGPFGEVAAGKG